MRAQEHLETSMRLDPLSSMRTAQLGLLGGALFAQGRYAEALAPLTEAMQISDTTSPIGYATLAACYGYLGQADRAAAALQRARALTNLPLPDLVANLVREQQFRARFAEGLRLAEAGAAAVG